MDDDLGVKYIYKADAEHLLAVLKQDYKCDSDWDGTCYLGLTLDWDYTNLDVHLSMPGYIEKALETPESATPTHHYLLWRHHSVCQAT
jgi:hypothetical protein